MFSVAGLKPVRHFYFRPQYGYRRRLHRSAIRYMPTGNARKLSRRALDSNGAEKSKRGGAGGSKSSGGVVRRKDTKQKVKSSASRYVIDSSDEEDRNGYDILDSPTVKTVADSSLVDTEEDEVTKLLGALAHCCQRFRHRCRCVQIERACTMLALENQSNISTP